MRILALRLRLLHSPRCCMSSLVTSRNISYVAAMSRIVTSSIYAGRRVVGASCRLIVGRTVRPSVSSRTWVGYTMAAQLYLQPTGVRTPDYAGRNPGGRRRTDCARRHYALPAAYRGSTLRVEHAKRRDREMKHRRVFTTSPPPNGSLHGQETKRRNQRPASQRPG